MCLMRSARQFAPEEVPDVAGDLGVVRLEREMPGVEEVDLGIGNVAPVRLRPRR